MPILKHYTKYKLLESTKKGIHDIKSTRIAVAAAISVILISCGDSEQARKETTWPDGQIKEHFQVMADSTSVRHGEYLSWYQTGRLNETGNYASGLKEGIWTTWHDTDDSARLMEGEFVDGEMHGLWKYWMDPSHHQGHQPDSSSHHGHSMSHSMSDSSRPSEQMADMRPDKIANFSAGVPHGLFMSWHMSGGVADSMTYRDGELHGTFVSYFPNGTKAAEAHYSDGVLAEPMSYFDSLGGPLSMPK
ncbi:MAG: hypothetical protein V3T31_01040 [candidate division Zixibacteria bacterium]